MEGLSSLLGRGMTDLTKKAGRPLSPHVESVGGEEPRTPEQWLDVYTHECTALRADDLRNGVHACLSNGMVYLHVSPDVLRTNAPRYEYPFQDLTFDRFSVGVYSKSAKGQAETTLKRCMKYVDEIDNVINNHGGIGIYLYSKTPGSGKTFLVSIVGAELIRRGKSVLWYSLPELLEEFKATYNRDSGTSESQAIQRVKNAPILILDDIGVEKQSAWVDEKIYSILNERLMRRRPTLFTSNLLPEELQYGHRTISRINTAIVLKMPEESVRGRIANRAERDVLALLDAE